MPLRPHTTGGRRPLRIRAGLLALVLTAAIALVACGDEPAATPVVPARGAEAGDPALFNTLKWSTAAEEDNVGFHVYRAPTAEGPFERLNADMVPGAGTTDERHDYEYVDSGIEAGRGYYYYVEAVASDGSTVQVTPVIHAPPKDAAVTDPAGETQKPDETAGG